MCEIPFDKEWQQQRQNEKKIDQIHRQRKESYSFFFIFNNNEWIDSFYSVCQNGKMKWIPSFFISFEYIYSQTLYN